MLSLVLSLTAMAEPPAVEPDPPPAALTPLDPGLLEYARRRHRRARALAFTMVGGIAMSASGAAIVVGSCGESTLECEGAAPAVGVGLIVVGSLVTTGGQLGFLTLAPLAEDSAIEAGLRVRPRLSWTPLVLTVGGTLLTAATIGRLSEDPRPPLATVGGAMTLGGLVLGFVQLGSVGSAHRRGLAVTPTANGAQASLTF